MIIHQITNSYQNYNYNAFIYQDTVYDKHFHGNYELIYVIDGTMHINAGKTDNFLSRGELLLIPPYTIHSFEIYKNSKVWIAVFSDDFINSFAQNYKSIEYSKFRCEPEKEVFLKKNLFYEGKPEHYTLIACLYLVCNECVKNAVSYNRGSDGDFMHKIIDYISKNFDTSITLENTADRFGYEKHYFSSLFHKCFSMHFCSFVNLFKFEAACQLLTDERLDITHISTVCGFGSIRNFNRVFKQIGGMTPGEYRKHFADINMYKKI